MAQLLELQLASSSCPSPTFSALSAPADHWYMETNRLHLEADVKCSNIMHTLPGLCSAALSLSSIITITFTEHFQYATLCAYYYSILQMKRLRFTEVKSLAQPRSQPRKWLIPRYSESLFIISYHLFSLCRCPNPLKCHPRALLFFTWIWVPSWDSGTILSWRKWKVLQLLCWDWITVPKHMVL